MIYIIGTVVDFQNIQFQFTKKIILKCEFSKINYMCKGKIQKKNGILCLKK